VNLSVLKQLNSEVVAVDICLIRLDELDKMWSFVGNKANQRWLWHAIERHSGKVLTYVFGRRKDDVFLQLKALLEPFGITRF
jgi:insertion element IS1 protein InsB